MLKKTQQRNKKYSISLWLFIVFFAASQGLMVAAYFLYTDKNNLSLAFFVIGYSTLVVATMSVTVLLFIAFFKFY